VVWVARRRLLTRSTRTLPAAWLRIGLSRVALLTLGCAAAIAPVTVRNLLVSGEPILIAAWGPAVFWAANNSDSDARQMCPPPLDTTTSPILQDLLEDPWFIASKLPQCLYIYAARQLGHRPSYSEGSSFYARLSLAYVRDYPGKLLSDAFRRFCYTFNAYECPLNKDLYSFLDFSRLLSALSYLHFGVICPVGVVGLLLMVARRTWPEGLAYYIAMIAALALSGTLFPVFARYRLPVVYLLMPMVAYGVVELAGRIARPTDWRRLLKPVALLAGLAVLSNANVFGFRPAHTEYLLFHFAAASVAAGRHDLVARTSDEIERALADPSRAERVATGPLEEFFKYFHDRDDVPRAARYAREMMRRGAKVDPRMLGGMMKIFIRAGWRDEAERALSALENATAGRPDPYLALAMLRYGRAYRDQDALAGAADLYGALLRLHPDHDKLRDGLTAARQALADLQTRPSSKPAGSRPVR